MLSQSVGSIGDWQRPLDVVDLMHLLGLYSSATPSETKNRYFSGEPDVPSPGVVIALSIAGMIAEKPVSWSLLSFWPLTVIRSMLPAAVWALDRLVDREDSDRSPCVSEEPPKS